MNLPPIAKNTGKIVFNAHLPLLFEIKLYDIPASPKTPNVEPATTPGPTPHLIANKSIGIILPAVTDPPLGA